MLKQVTAFDVPASQVIFERVKNYFPALIPVKFGEDFDKDMYQIFFLGGNRRSAIDFPRDLLNDIAENKDEADCTYTKSLLGKLDAAILNSLSSAGAV